MLEGDTKAATPHAWIISRIMEEGLAPTLREAERAWDEDTSLICDILEMRAFAGAKAEVDAASQAGREVPLTPAIRHYYTVLHARLKEGN